MACRFANDGGVLRLSGRGRHQAQILQELAENKLFRFEFRNFSRLILRLAATVCAFR
jgi:hypothetical protein